MEGTSSENNVTGETHNPESEDIQYINVQEDDIPYICRTCFSKDISVPIFTVSEEQTEDNNIPRLFDECLSLQIRECDSLPKYLCAVCYEELIRVYTFRVRCRFADQTLKNLFPEEDFKKHEIIIQEDNLNTNDPTNSNPPLQDTNLAVETAIPINVEPVASAQTDSSDGDYSDCSENCGCVSDDSDCLTSKKNCYACKDLLQQHELRKKLGKHRVLKCEICSRDFLGKVALFTHKRETGHYKRTIHACNLCPYKGKNKYKLQVHMRTHTKEKPYKCYQCPLSFGSKGNFTRHLKLHTGEKRFMCELCGKGFIQSTSLQTHRKTHTKMDTEGNENSIQFMCNFCGRGFKRIAPYNIHLRKHEIESGIITKEAIDDQEERIYSCDMCPKSYKTKTLLKAHKLTHGERSYLCSECGKGFITKGAMQSHLKIHTGERPHVCTICNKSFAHIGSFDTHMLIHTGLRPHVCKICGKTFTQLSHVKYHLRTHSGERPYRCTYCGKTFALKGNLTVHVRTHTGETPYHCRVCGKGFYDSSSRKKHQKNHGTDREDNQQEEDKEDTEMYDEIIPAESVEKEHEFRVQEHAVNEGGMQREVTARHPVNEREVERGVTIQHPANKGGLQRADTRHSINERGLQRGVATRHPVNEEVVPRVVTTRADCYQMPVKRPALNMPSTD